MKRWFCSLPPNFFHALLLVVLCVSSAFLQSCSDDNPVTPPADNPVEVTLRIYGVFGAAPLQLNQKYQTAGGDNVQFSMIRFYLSEIALVDSLGQEVPVSDHKISLVDFSDATTAQQGYFSVKVKANPGTYRGVKFGVGVPFAENHKDAATQSLPLGPNSDMFWGWNPGYIFHRIEGKADSASASVDFIYHIGLDNHFLTVMLANLTGASRTVFNVSATATNTFSVNADYSKLFSIGMNPPNAMLLRANPGERVTHSFGGAAPLADRIFGNMQTIFSIRP